MFPHHDSIAHPTRWQTSTGAPPSPADGAAQPRTITIICEADRRAHEITADDIAAGQRSGNRRYQAICGYHFTLPAPRFAIGAPPCQQCAAVLAAANQPAPTTHRTRHARRRPGWWWS